MHCCLVTAKQKAKPSITAMKQQLRRIINSFLGGKTILQEWCQTFRERGIRAIGVPGVPRDIETT
jgi:hypothetical protein